MSTLDGPLVRLILTISHMRFRVTPFFRRFLELGAMF